MVPFLRLRTTCVERDWHGGCERSTPTCSDSQVSALFTALNDIYDKVEECDLTGLQDLKDCILSAHENVVWRCASLGDSIVGQTSGNEITITPTAFGGTPERLEAIIFHEIIHSCGGTELDCEAFENHCYRGNGATPPTPDDFPKFRNSGGHWVNWNGSTGAVTTSNDQSLNVNNSDFVDPDSSDGGW